jgi:3-hydroxyisobutyrate dehydrogenase-like beta-hydroxyacid dehydrogenase
MARKSQKNIGLIGLGIIGSRIAAALRAAGFNVFVWNRTPRPHPNFLGSPAEVAEACDIIQIFVADGRALMDVINEFGGKLTPNHIVINSSTIGPEATLEAAKLVESLGAKFLDAPFTGSKMAAEKAQLVYYIGGSDETLRQVEPVLRAGSKAIVKIGETGQAAAVKIATNMLVAATVQTLAEAMALVKKSGVPPESLAAALENHGVRSGLTDMKLPGMLKADFDPHFSVKHMLKDMQLAIGMAQSHSVELPVTTAAARVLYDAANRGWTDLDFSSVLRFYEDEPESSPEPPPAATEPLPATEPVIEPATPAIEPATPETEPTKSSELIPPAEPEAAEPAQPERPRGFLQRLFGKKSG